MNMMMMMMMITVQVRKYSLVNALESCIISRESRNTASPYLNLGTRWKCVLRLWTQLPYPLGKLLASFEWEAGQDPRPVRTLCTRESLLKLLGIDP